MSSIELEVDGERQGFHEVWVHLQDVSHQDTVDYRISVAATYVHQVFDPYSTKGPESPWPNFILKMIRELGTFIVEGLIENIGAIIGNREKAYLWVIATVDETVETENGIDPKGRAVRFLPHG